MISEESLVPPSFTGTGIIRLEASMGGYYTFDLARESWIILEVINDAARAYKGVIPSASSR